MRTPFYVLVSSFVFLAASLAVGQRQELSISPVGFFYPKNQLIQYERYVNSRHSATVSLSHNGSGRGYGLFDPPRTERFAITRGVVGVRRYSFSSLYDGGFTAFGSIRLVIDYSALQLESDPRYPIPADSLRLSGFSLAPELIIGGKLTLAKRITLSGAFGAQHLFKLLSTAQLTRNQAYWNGEYWSRDDQDWQDKRNMVVNHRRGWYPSFLFTLGVVLGKPPIVSRP